MHCIEDSESARGINIMDICNSVILTILFDDSRQEIFSLVSWWWCRLFIQWNIFNQYKKSIPKMQMNTILCLEHNPYFFLLNFLLFHQSIYYWTWLDFSLTLFSFLQSFLLYNKYRTSELRKGRSEKYNICMKCN